MEHLGNDEGHHLVLHILIVLESNELMQQQKFFMSYKHQCKFLVSYARS